MFVIEQFTYFMIVWICAMLKKDFMTWIPAYTYLLTYDTYNSVNESSIVNGICSLLYIMYPYYSI